MFKAVTLVFQKYLSCHKQIEGTSGCDKFGSWVTEFCRGYLQVNPTEVRCSPTGLDGWQSYFDMRSIPEGEKDNLAWDRLEAVMSMNNPS